MAFAGQHGRIGGPEIGIGHRTLAVYRWQRVPEFLRGRRIPLANGDTHDLARVPIQGEPNPPLLLFCGDKRPEFITLQRQPAFFLG